MSGNKKHKIVLLIAFALVAALLLLAINLMGGIHMQFAQLSPKGTIAVQQKRMIIMALSLMLVVVIPVFAATIIIARRYRAGNDNAEYNPDWQGSRKLQILWWAFPGTIILILGGLTWYSAHKLDPFRPLQSANKPVTIEVVALEWKWLFIYPEQNIATVNYVVFPENTPVHFVLTADAPMNSFWIPQLGSQMYAMQGMATQLNLMADQAGEYQGEEVEINGKGYAGMRFVAKSVARNDFQKWVETSHTAHLAALTPATYSGLAQPSTDASQSTYSSADLSLFDSIIDKFGGNTGHAHSHPY